MNQDPHEFYMRMALRQAQLALEEGEVPAGCVIVRLDSAKPAGMGTLIGSAHNQVELLKDPTAHAEMVAITQASNAIGDWRLTNTVLYVTKEPCPMCAGAIVLARIPTVVFGIADPQRGGAGSVFDITNHAGSNHRSKVVQGVMEAECKALFDEFFQNCRSRNGETRSSNIETRNKSE
jgi:tRNA(adenine34) deaminase